MHAHEARRIPTQPVRFPPLGSPTNPPCCLSLKTFIGEARRASFSRRESGDVEVLEVDAPTRQVAHRPTDAARAVVALILLVLTSAAALRGDLDLESWQTFVLDVPSWILQGCVVIVIIALAVALLLCIASILRIGSDPKFARDVFVALALTIIAGYVLSLIVVDGGVEAGTLDPTRTDLLTFPDLVIAVITAVIVAASTHVARPNRRLLWWLVVVATTCATLTDPLALLPVVAGLTLGLAIGSGWLSLVGSPAGLPETSVLLASLHRHGVAVDGLTMLASPTWGGAVICLAHRLSDGSPLRMKVYGRDAATADFWVRLVRRITYLDAQRTWSGKGIDSVEHEAAVTALADQFGAPVTSVVAVSDWAEADPFIAVEWPGVGVDELPATSITDATLSRIWQGVGTLHQAGIVHGGLDGTSIRIDGQT